MFQQGIFVTHSAFSAGIIKKRLSCSNKYPENRRPHRWPWCSPSGRPTPLCSCPCASPSPPCPPFVGTLSSSWSPPRDLSWRRPRWSRSTPSPAGPRARAAVRRSRPARCGSAPRPMTRVGSISSVGSTLIASRPRPSPLPPPTRSSAFHLWRSRHV